MKKKFRIWMLASAVFLMPIASLAAVTDFTANSNITVPSVTFGVTTANLIILNGSTAESWLFSAGAFTVTNPGTAFQVGSSDSNVKSIQVTKSGTAAACAENTTPGSSAVTIPSGAGTYTISPSAGTSCTNLCASVSNSATYNSFPTCGAATCIGGFVLSGSGSGATCEMPSSGASSVSSHREPSPSPASAAVTAPAPPALASVVAATSQNKFNTNLKIGMRSSDVYKLQQLLSTDKQIYPSGDVSGYYGQETKKAIERFQVKYNILTSNKNGGFGSVGPKTRAKINEVFKLNSQ